MTLLALGLILWIGAHALKRLAPTMRANMNAKLGEGPAKGIIAGILVLSVVLMVIGYRGADTPDVYVVPGWGLHLNNLLMLAAVALLGMGSSKGRARSWLRHPMLSGVMVWALAHLLVNSDLASVVLFGGLLFWSVGQMVLINHYAGPWERPEPGPAKGDVRWLIISLVVFGVIAGLHSLLGPWPFPG